MFVSRLHQLPGALALLLATACAHGAPGADDPPADAADIARVDADDDPPADAADVAPDDAAPTAPDDAAPTAPDAATDGDDAVLVAPLPVGEKAVGSFLLPASPKLRRLSVNSCAGASLGLSSATTSFRYLELRNPSATQGVVVSVWTARAPGGPIIDTILAAYAGAAPPASDSARLGCTVGVEQGCASDEDPSACITEPGGRDWAGLMDGDGRGVTIPASSSATLYVAAYDTGESGELLVIVRTEAWR